MALLFLRLSFLEEVISLLIQIAHHFLIKTLVRSAAMVPIGVPLVCDAYRYTPRVRGALTLVLTADHDVCC
jgi:hypothetical protein